MLRTWTMLHLLFVAVSASDESCWLDGSECELSLRQLRVKTSSVPTSQASQELDPVPADLLEKEGPEDSFDKLDQNNTLTDARDLDLTDLPLPGGWGEAASAAEKNLMYYHSSRRLSPSPSPPPPPGPVMTLYHQTSPAAAAMILKNGFRPGRYGWCGGGIYFATSPEATGWKAIGDYSHKGFILKATVRLGKVKEMGSRCGMWNRKGSQLKAWGFDSIHFNPGDGEEYVVYSSSNVISVSPYL